MTKALLVGDIHLADRPPSIRVDGYADQILDKLRQTVALRYSEDCDFVVWAGDVFHVKAPTRTSHRLVQQACDIVAAYGCNVYIVPGNHDVTHDRLGSLDKQPLGVLFKAGAIPCIGGNRRGDPVFGIPWLRDWASELPPYMETWINEDWHELMVTHAPIVRSGEDRPFEVIDAGDWVSMMDRYGDVFFGHMHDPDGVFEQGIAHIPFCNEGAISRGSLHEATLRRKPAVSIWDNEQPPGAARFRRVELDHLPAREVFKLDAKELVDDRQERLTEFLTTIDQTTFEALTIEGVMAHIESIDLDDDVRKEIRECLEVAL